MKEENEKTGKKFVRKEEAEQTAKQLNYNCYLECSAQKNQGVSEVFEACVKFATDPQIKKKDCIIS